MAYLALDLGASNGRAIVGCLQNDKLVLDEVYRFPNRQVRLGDTLYWDFPALFADIKEGITAAVRKGYRLHSLAVDTWGVDFGLLDENGRLLSNPVCYRDARTQGMLNEAFRLFPKDDFFRATGNQFMEINTAFQLLSLAKHNDPQLAAAKKLLFTPDLVNYFLSGFIGNEYTIASTSQLLHAQRRDWEDMVFEKLGLPRELCSPLVFPGTPVGVLHPAIAAETGAGQIHIIAVGSHDTASAVAAIPASGNDWAYLSSGTWSLLGIETTEAIMTDKALQHNFTNEGGVGGKIRFLRNSTGLWILQQLMAVWEKQTGAPCSYEQLLAEAAQASSFKGCIDPDDACFTAPASMQDAIVEYCQRNSQAIPSSKGEFVYLVLASLARKYSEVVRELQLCTGRKINRLYIVGGGSRNELLNQLTADALGIPVICGAVESTVMGNILLQAIADGAIKDLDEGRQLIARSIDRKQYNPKH